VLRQGSESATTSYVCSNCGYGAALRGDPPPCPMCRGTDWEPAPWRPFSTLEEVTAAAARAAARRTSDSA
jgi:hypothetical protein